MEKEDGKYDELDAICRNIAQMIEDKYEVKGLTKEMVMAFLWQWV